MKEILILIATAVAFFAILGALTTAQSAHAGTMGPALVDEYTQTRCYWIGNTMYCDTY